MLIPQTTIERAFNELLERTRSNASAWSEFAASRGEFLGSVVAGNPRTREMAERRHAEWFLLERPSESLELVPAQVLGADADDTDETELVLGREALLGSFASVFEITGVRAGEGVWVRDLAGLGEYPLEEADASRALESGDLLVGRIFPVGDELYRISHASGFFRDADLLGAVRADLERAREGRRGVLRLSQRDLEAMFFGSPIHATPTAQAAGAAIELRRQALMAVSAARRCLEAGGLAPAEVDDVLAGLASEPFDPRHVLPGAGDRLGEILATLAFETEVDLEAARRALAEAWPVLSSPPPPGNATHEKRPAQTGRRKQAGSAPSGKVQRALSDFDARRAQADDLEALFADLERELEIEPEDAGDDATAPDFPGVVGAMVIEFLWDMERERGAEAARPLAAIANFAQFAQAQGVFENLGERDLLMFACLWLPERAQDAAEAERSFHALVEFATWAEEQHAVSLASALAPSREGLASSLPRVCAANARLRARLGKLHEGGEMLGYEGGSAARSSQGEARAVAIAKEAAAHVEAGDFLRAEKTPGSEWRVVCVYPPQTSKLAGLI